MRVSMTVPSSCRSTTYAADARPVGDRLDQLGAVVDEADAVVGGVRGRQVALLDQRVQQRPALLLAVVVDAVAVGQEAESGRGEAQVGAVAVGRAADVPADRAGRDAAEDDPALPALAQHLIDAVHPPDREQVRDRPAADPDDVLGEQVGADVVDVRHREQLEVGGAHVGARERAVETAGAVERVATGGADVAEPRTRRVTGQVDGVLDQRTRAPEERPEIRGHEAAGGGEDAHGLTPRVVGTQQRLELYVVDPASGTVPDTDSEVSSATHSTWWVIGNRSKARSRSQRVAVLGEDRDVAGQGGRVAGDVGDRRAEPGRRPARRPYGGRPRAAGRGRPGRPAPRDAARGPRRPRPWRTVAPGTFASACSQARRSPSTSVTARSAATASARNRANSPTPAYRSSTDSPGRGARKSSTVSTSTSGAPGCTCQKPSPATSNADAVHRCGRPERRRSGSRRPRRRRATGACASPAARRAAST